MPVYEIIRNGKQSVTTPGTAVQLVAASPTPCGNCTVTANQNNTDVICIGGSNVLAAIGSRNAAVLTPGASMPVPINDLSKVWIDAVVAGEGVTFTYFA